MQKKYKYILNCLDHFLKFLISFLIEKNINVISEKINIIFKKFGVPEQIGCDNGSEFVIKKVKNLLSKNNIELSTVILTNPILRGLLNMSIE